MSKKPPKINGDIDALCQIMRDLRDKEGGCPWDVEQDFQSIAPHTLEEAYEVVDAIERGDIEHLKEELGDLLFQVIFHCQMASEMDAFSLKDVIENVCAKMVHRHPHVYADASIETAEQQEDAWEELKSQEKNHDATDDSILSSVITGLPALTRAYKLQKKAARVGFDWPDVEGAMAKVDEELLEVKNAKQIPDIHEELGDLLFSVVNVARKYGAEPDSLLRVTNHKFERRFRYIESELRTRNISLDDADLELMDGLWNESKDVV